MPAMMTWARTSLAATGVVVALAGCGGGSGNSFTIKADSSGHVAYLVVTSDLPRRALEGDLRNGMRSEGTAFVTTNNPAGAHDCSWHGSLGSIGIPGIPALDLHRYSSGKVTVDVYGSGSFADGICSDLQLTSG
jgi:hypothetical protein